MSLRINAVIEIPDEELAKLLDARPPSEGSGLKPIAHASLATTVGLIAADSVELPTSWTQISEESRVTYTWPEPEGPDIYDPFRTFEGMSAGGTVRLAIGECDRTPVRGEERKYFIAGHVSPSGSFRPVAEFLATDDYEQTHETIAIIRGKEGSAKMYDPADQLPGIYDQFEVETYRDRVNKPRSYSKLGIVAHEEDFKTMLSHTLIQAQSRLGLGPA